MIGISAFGLDDCAAFSGGCACVTADVPASVIASQSPLEPPLAGRMAWESRIESGLRWPEETRFQPFPRRMPVALGWKRLVESREESAYWQTGKRRVGMAGLLAAHIAAIAAESRQAENEQQWIVAIPNLLDEYAQTDLLQALKRHTKDPVLIWRPVAAALRWLAEVDTALCVGKTLHVLWAGLDALELTSFELKRMEAQGYVLAVPKRSRPGFPGNFVATGLDWGVSFLGSVLPRCRLDIDERDRDIHALWQALFRFPHLWRFARDPSIQENFPPQPWLIRDATGDEIWSKWAPVFTGRDPLNAPYREGLWHLYLGDQKGDPQKNAPSWREKLRASINWDDLAGENSAGLIVAGPLANLMRSFLRSHLKFSLEPTPGSGWLANHSCIAEGALLYGELLRKGLPTYLDHLPPLKMLHIADNKHAWAKLLDAEEIPGGGSYANTIKGIFQLKKDNAFLDMYLTQEEENHKKGWRVARVDFPEAPDTDVPLTIDVSMRPAAGLACVTLTPETKFLDGQPIPFDFRRMAPTDTLPELTLGWPEERDPRRPLQDMTPYVYPEKFLDWRPARALVPSLREYEKDAFLAILKDLMLPFKKINFPIIAEDGAVFPGRSEEIVKSIGHKLEEVWSYFNTSSDAQSFLTPASYLWRSLPKSIQHDIAAICRRQQRIQNYNNFNYIAEAAGRCLTDVDDCRAFFEAIYHENLNTNLARAASRLLRYNSHAKKALDDSIAYSFVNSAILLAEVEVAKRNIKYKFFEAAELFLNALKQRANNYDFMNREKDKQIEKRYDAMAVILEKAAEIEKSNERLLELLKGVRDFMDYKGSPGLIERIAQEADRR